MKKLFTLIIALFPALLMAQGNNFTIEGKLGNLSSPAMLFLSYNNSGKNMTDSCNLVDGVFKLTGQIQSPSKCFLVVYHLGKKAKGFNNDARSMWLEPAKIRINSPDSLKRATITGSKLNEDERELNEALTPYVEGEKEFHQKNGFLSMDKHEPAQFVASYNKGMQVLEQQRKAIQLRFIKSHPNSLISLVALMSYGTGQNGTVPDVAVVRPLFNALSVPVKGSEMGKAYQANMVKWGNVGVGSIAPDFAQTSIDGKQIKLSNYQGKYVLVDFWASWCHPCRDENPNLVKQYNLYKDKNFTVLSVSLDESKNDWLKAVKEDKLPWEQVSDLKRHNEAREKYGVQAIPDNFLIGPDGVIIAKSLRGDDLNSKLKEIFDK